MEILSVEVVVCKSGWGHMWNTEVRTFLLCNCGVEVVNSEGFWLNEEPKIQVTGTPQQIARAKGELFNQAA